MGKLDNIINWIIIIDLFILSFFFFIMWLVVALEKKLTLIYLFNFYAFIYLVVAIEKRLFTWYLLHWWSSVPSGMLHGCSPGPSGMLPSNMVVPRVYCDNHLNPWQHSGVGFCTGVFLVGIFLLPHALIFFFTFHCLASCGDLAAFLFLLSPFRLAMVL